MAFSEKRYLNRLKYELKRRGLSDEILKDVVEAFDSARECGESPEAVAERLGTPAAFAESFGGSKARSVHVFAIISAVFIIIGIVLTVAMSLSNGVPSDAIGFAESGIFNRKLRTGNIDPHFTVRIGGVVCVDRSNSNNISL